MARPTTRRAPATTTGSPLPKPGDPHTLYVVDLSGYVFRAYHAIAPLSNSKGEPTHAVYGTTQMLNLLVRQQQPAYLAVAMDSPGPTFREDIDAGYKAHREAPPPDLSQQMRRCEQVARAYGIPIYCVDGVEADDLIATLARRIAVEHPELTVVVLSSDKDLMQLVGPKLVCWDTMRSKVYGEPEVVEKFGVPPQQLRDVLALMGDTSDNVPGVPTVGAKTSADLIRRFGSVDALYERLGELEKVKLREQLRTSEREARLSQRLVTLRDDVPIDVDLGALRYQAPQGAAAVALKALFSDLEFLRLAEAVDVRSSSPGGGEPKDGAAADGVAAGTSGSGPAIAATSGAPAHARASLPLSYRALTEVADLHAFLADLARARLEDPTLALGIHLEATSAHPADAAAVGLAMSFRSGQAVYLSIGHRYLGAPPPWTASQLVAELGAVFSDPTLPKVGHDLKLAIQVLGRMGMELRPVAFDSLLASYLLDPAAPAGLREVARAELGSEPPSREQTFGKDRRGQSLAFEQVTVEDAARWAGAFADLARDLRAPLASKLERDGLLPLLEELELPLQAVLAEVERQGILLDADVMRSLSSEVEKQLRSIEERARAQVAEHLGATAAAEFNCGSPKQVEHVLFDVLKLPVVKRTKTSRSTDADVLEELAEQHVLPAIILEHRVLHKLVGTYLDALPRLVSPRTGRLHTTYQQHVAATGRLSSVEPNLQNIPIRTDLGRRIREAFIAPPGFVLLAADYSQIELRVLAHLSEDPILVDAFAHEEDIHARTAQELFGEVTKDSRRAAKAVNFGVVYGQGETALARSLGIPQGRASDFIKRYFERYAGVRKFMDEQIEVARRGVGIRTLLQRRRFLPDIHSANRMLRAQAERIARNTPIQGTAADILKLAMVALRTAPVPGARMLLTVHDELVFEVPEGVAEQAAAVVTSTMQTVTQLRVPLKVDVGWGRSWAEAHR